jgi:phosphate transport system permease protein
MSQNSRNVETLMNSLSSDEPPIEVAGPLTDARTLSATRTRADRIYRGISTGAGLLTLVLLVFIGSFLLIRSKDALSYSGLKFFTNTQWQPQGTPAVFGILAIMYWTIIIAVISLVIAIPLALAVAIFLTDFAPRSLRKVLTAMVDLLAAIPSLIYGLWGLFVLQPLLVPFAGALSRAFPGVPFLKVDSPAYTSSAFIAGVVVSLMVLPIIASIVREVFSQAPMGEREAALALGSTRWDMIRTVVLPFGRGGIIGGSMLGLGRALGETIAVALIISPTFVISPQVLHTGSNSVAALIALKFGEASGLALSALMAAGLSLFVLTLIVNFLASIVVSRSRSGAGVDI